MELLKVSNLLARAFELGYTFDAERHYLHMASSRAYDVSGREWVPVRGPHESPVVASEKPVAKPVGAKRWWEEVISQIVAWAGTEP